MQMICNAKTDHFHQSKAIYKKKINHENILEIKRSESHVPGHVAIVFYPKKCVSISHLYLDPFFFTLHTTSLTFTCRNPSSVCFSYVRVGCTCTLSATLQFRVRNKRCEVISVLGHLLILSVNHSRAV